ncbi:MAG: hypothetical protein ACYSTS_08810 [Planctomycetota bacterium]
MSNRDDFIEGAKQLLAKRTGLRCLNCRATTSGPSNGPIKVVSLYMAAHITAASDRGPRS